MGSVLQVSSLSSFVRLFFVLLQVFVCAWCFLWVCAVLEEDGEEPKRLCQCCAFFFLFFVSSHVASLGDPQGTNRQMDPPRSTPDGRGGRDKVKKIEGDELTIKGFVLLKDNNDEVEEEQREELWGPFRFFFSFFCFTCSSGRNSLLRVCFGVSGARVGLRWAVAWVWLRLWVQKIELVPRGVAWRGVACVSFSVCGRFVLRCCRVAPSPLMLRGPLCLYSFSWCCLSLWVASSIWPGFCRGQRKKGKLRQGMRSGPANGVEGSGS